MDADGEVGMTPYEYMWADRAYFEDFVSRATYHSNAIEGNTLTLAETYAIQWNDSSMRVTATARELYEAINLKYALTVAMEDSESELRESLVKRVAREVSRNVSELEDYRRVQVMIRGAEHVPPSPQQVRPMMMELVYAYNLDVRSGRDAFEREAKFHIGFERIHPFEDGNGRTGRILLQRGLMLSGIAPAVISKDSRAEYLGLIAARDAAGLAALLADVSAGEQARLEAFAASRSAGNLRGGQEMAFDDLARHRGTPVRGDDAP